MKKVLILANKIPYPSKDGSSIAMARTLECILELPNIHVTYGAINTLKHRKHVDDFPHQIKSQIELKTFEEDTSPNTFTGLYNLLLTSKPYNATRFLVHSMREWLYSFDDGHFDVVIIEGAFMGYYLPLAKVKGKKVVLRTHNLEHIIWARTASNMNDPLRRFYLKIQSNRLHNFEERITQLSDAIWSISPVDAFWFKALNSNTYHVPVAVSPAEPLQEVVPMKCFHLGALDWKPNLIGLDWFLSQVWPRVLKSRPQAEFHIAGNNTPTRIKSDPSKNIFVHGRVPSAEAFASSHGISVIPLLSGSGIRIKLLENGRSGIPIISTRIGAEGVYDEHNPLIPLSDFPADFAKKLVNLLDDPAKSLQLGKDIRKDILERFGFEQAVEMMKEAWPS